MTSDRFCHSIRLVMLLWITCLFCISSWMDDFVKISVSAGEKKISTRLRDELIVYGNNYRPPSLRPSSEAGISTWSAKNVNTSSWKGRHGCASLCVCDLNLQHGSNRKIFVSLAKITVHWGNKHDESYPENVFSLDNSQGLIILWRELLISTGDLNPDVSRSQALLKF